MITHANVKRLPNKNIKVTIECNEQGIVTTFLDGGEVQEDGLYKAVQDLILEMERAAQPSRVSKAYQDKILAKAKVLNEFLGLMSNKAERTSGM